MTNKLFEAYKAGTYVPCNNCYIETYKPVYIPRHSYTYGHAGGVRRTTLPVSNKSLVSVVFNGPYITYSVNRKSDYVCHNPRTVCTLLHPPFTLTVHYKNIKAFH